MKIRSYILCVFLLFVGVAHLEAGYIIKNGWFVDEDECPTYSPEKHYAIACGAMQHNDWKVANKHFRIVAVNFPEFPCQEDATFFTGVSYYKLQEYDFANDAFTNYLKHHPQYFEEALEYKYAIACQLKSGERHRFFGISCMPKWASGLSLAMEIYDEIIATVPCHELAAYSLYQKGDILRSQGFYNESIEVYQLLIKRFPKHELAPDSYLVISSIYLDQSCSEEQNPDLLAFAQINLKRFQRDYPREERICEVENDIQTLKETYACSLYERGLFYERKCHPEAAVLYYQNAIDQFPDTRIAQSCKYRLMELEQADVLDEV